MPCNCCEITDNTFGEDEAKAILKDYRKRGPAKQTKLILEAIHSLDIKSASLLDIGGGIGVIHHELLADSTAQTATHVDASSAYLKVAKEESGKRGNIERVQFIHADFTVVASDLPVADVVTLDRVVCCYPDFINLLTLAASHSAKAIALTYPREVWYTKLATRIGNFVQRLRKDPFRVFVHPVDEMEKLLGENGFKRISMKQLIIWEMALYTKTVDG